MRCMQKLGWSAVALLMVSVSAGAQTPQPENPDAPKKCTMTMSTPTGGTVTETTDCKTQQPANTPATKQFPYPGESSSGQDGAAPAAQGDAGQQAPAANAPAAKKFPFPGETAPTPDAAGIKDAGSSGESSSSSGDSSSSDSGSSAGDMGGSDPNDVDSDTPVAPKRHLHPKPVPLPKSIAEQEGEDLQIAAFYMNDKNWHGAYLRAQDAVKLAGDDADAHLALAEAARKIGKLDEAEKNYRQALTLDPVPKTKKAAQEALKEMTGGN